MPTLRFDEDEFKKAQKNYKGELDTDKLFAQKIGMSTASVNRVRNGKQKPGPEFIASVWRHLGPQWVTRLVKPVD